MLFKRFFSFTALLTQLFFFLFIQASVHANTLPNVVLLITDDQGFGDLSYYGNPLVETPHMDKIAEQSVRFTDFHVDPTCAPTRAALMAGKYAHRVGVWHTISGGNHLRDSEVTMANVFKQAGYSTGLFGKWHLGSNYPYRPMDRGFDEWLGQGDGGTGTTDDWFDNDRVNDFYWHNGERVKREGFATDVFFDSAIDYIQKQHKRNQPFFVKVSTYLPHSPHTLPDYQLKDEFKGKVSNYVAQFLASVERIDSNIGKLEKTLNDLKLTDNTIFIFMTDNGSASGVSLYNAGMRGSKGSVYEGGHRVPFFIRWPKGKLQHGHDVEQLTSHIDVLPTLIDLVGLKNTAPIDFDGRSFKAQLINSRYILPNRTIFVETQRTLKPVQWEKTAGMMHKWRLIDNKALYHIGNDPSQSNNVIEEYPGVANSIRRAYKKYWKRVTPNDRDAPIPIVGHNTDPETFLQASDWQLPNTPWNHAQIAAGDPQVGKWHINVAQSGTYRFEVRRWPREADATIQGVPEFNKKLIDAWNEGGPVNQLVYGGNPKALPVNSIKLEVGDFSYRENITPKTKKVIVDIPLKQGETVVQAIMEGVDEKVIAGAYYLYITKK